MYHHNMSKEDLITTLILYNLIIFICLSKWFLSKVVDWWNDNKQNNEYQTFRSYFYWDDIELKFPSLLLLILEIVILILVGIANIIRMIVF